MECKEYVNMKTLVVDHSHSGNTKQVAKMIADRLQADIEPIEPLKRRQASRKSVSASP